MKIKYTEMDIKTERISKIIFYHQPHNKNSENYFQIKEWVENYLLTQFIDYTSLKEWYLFAKYIKLKYNTPMTTTFEILDEDITVITENEVNKNVK